jgi:hypothetical protein
MPKPQEIITPIHLKYGIFVKTNPSGCRARGITDDGFRQMIADFPGLFPAALAVGVSCHLLRKWEREKGVGWPKTCVRPDCRNRRTREEAEVRDAVIGAERIIDV